MIGTSIASLNQSLAGVLSSTGSASVDAGGSSSAAEAKLHSAEQALAVDILGGDLLQSNSAGAAQTAKSALAEDSSVDPWPETLSLTLLGGDNSQLSPAAQDQTQQMLNSLLDSSDGSPSLLAQATGEGYSASNPPDYLAISTGSSVTPDYAGGYNSVGWDFDGADVTFFSVGQEPNVTKGFAITFASDASPASRQSTIQMAQSYLSNHLSDSQNTAGAWNQPTFDVTVH